MVSAPAERAALLDDAGAGVSLAWKTDRWTETVKWAERHGFSHLIPTIREQDAYLVNNICHE